MIRLTLRMLALVAVLALVAAACGGDDSADAGADIATLETEAPVTDGDDAGDAASDEVDSAETAVLEFTECLRGEGIDVGDPTINADGSIDFQSLAAQGGFEPGDESVQAAFEVCGELLEGVALIGTQVDDTEFQDSLLAVTECLREAGYDVADPDFSAFGGGPGDGRDAIFGDNFDVNDPDNQEALQVCADEVGFARPGGNG